MLILVLLLLCTCISWTLNCVHLSSTLPAILNLLPLSVSAVIARLMASMRSSSATWGFFLRHFVYSSSLLVNNMIRNPQNPQNKTAFLPFTSLTTTFHNLFHQPPITKRPLTPQSVTFFPLKVFQRNPPCAWTCDSGGPHKVLARSSQTSINTGKSTQFRGKVLSDRPPEMLHRIPTRF